MSGSYPTLTLTVIAAAVLAAHRFVDQDGTLPAAGGAAFGVTRTSAAIGDPTPVDVQGTTLVMCGGTVAKDEFVMTDDTGRAVKLAGTGVYPLGRAMSAGASGAVIEVLLVPSNGQAVPAPAGGGGGGT